MIRQLAVGGFDRNFSYLAWDDATRTGFVVDPCGEPQVILDAIARDRVTVTHLFNTHGHRDHTSGNEAVREATGAVIAVHELDAGAGRGAGRLILKGDETIPFGGSAATVTHTPGHTRGSVCVRFQDGLFTGDTLFVDWCGFAFDQRVLYDTLQTVLRTFPDTLTVYPGHDYGKTPTARLGEEKRHNPYLQAQDFATFKERCREL